LLIPWEATPRNSWQWVASNAKVVNRPDTSFCHPDPLLNKFFSLEKISALEFFEICNRFGGHLPRPKSKQEIIDLHKEIKEAMDSLEEDASSTCYDTKGNVYFYLDWASGTGGNFTAANGDVLASGAILQDQINLPPSLCTLVINGNLISAVECVGFSIGCGVCILPKSSHVLKVELCTFKPYHL